MRIHSASAFLVAALLTLSCGTASSPPAEAPPPTPTPIVEPDTTAPTVPTGFTVSAIGTTTAAFSWSASTDDAGVSEYRVFRNGAQVATITAISYQATSLTASTAYTFTVQACDAAGNCSGQGQVIVTTAAVTSPPAPAPAFSGIAVSAGGPSSHSCVVESGGTIRCWGRNNRGQLGDGTTTDASIPVRVSGITTATAVSAGLSSFTCALLVGGQVKCWGYNAWGLLGNGTVTDSSVPVAVSGLVSAISISAGDVHACAGIANGTVQCWGRHGPDCILGSPQSESVPCGAATALSSLPQTVVRASLNPLVVTGELSSVIAVKAGGRASCALLASGGISCWGVSTWVAPGPGGATQYFPVDQVSGITTATDLSVGIEQACARLSNGTVKCWGRNRATLGDGATIEAYSPVLVSGITTATGVSIASRATVAGITTFVHTCVLLSSSRVACWGPNEAGQLGDGSFSGPDTCVPPINTPCRTTPIVVPDLETVTGIGTGGAHTCTLQATGAVRCWGANQYGQLGNGTLTSRTSPALVSGF